MIGTSTHIMAEGPFGSGSGSGDQDFDPHAYSYIKHYTENVSAQSVEVICMYELRV